MPIQKKTKQNENEKMSDCDSSSIGGSKDSVGSDDYSGETPYKSSTHGASTSDASSEHEEMERAIAQLESKRVAQARIAVITVLMLFAGASGFVTYFFTQKGLETSFDIQVRLVN